MPILTNDSTRITLKNIAWFASRQNTGIFTLLQLFLTELYGLGWEFVIAMYNETCDILHSNKIYTRV